MGTPDLETCIQRKFYKAIKIGGFLIFNKSFYFKF